METIAAGQALLADGWARDVRLHVDAGRISRIEKDVAARPGDTVCDILIPGMANLHSHAFQHAMAGLAETRGPGDDSFWSWRTIMYRFALSMRPDQVQAIAAKLYCDMLEAGFTRVGEFHYLHHTPTGTPYANRAEMAERIAAAAEESGIGLTLLPVFYAHSGFGGKPPADGQRRFLHDLDGYADLLEGCRAAVKPLAAAVLGIAPHSLRAATETELRALLTLSHDGPVHIHIAEQVKEVEDSIAFSGARPVEWLLDNMPVDRRWCLIHATHMTEAETAGMAASGAIAGLCPITEANLGDGTFNAVPFRAAGGRYGIGSDSNVLIGVADELRQLEYSERLARQSRNVIAPPGKSTGRTLFGEALDGGAAALGVETGLAEGRPADLVALSARDIPWMREDAVLDSLIFAGAVKPCSVWVHGRQQVEGGRHRDRDQIQARFRAAMLDLVAANP
nr:formimidoylglutamate deiminase [uncultured Gellertiella sp.]